MRGDLFAAIAASIAFFSVMPQASADDDGFDCRYVGPNVLEPLGDRDGHGLHVIEISCTVTIGPLTGGTLTATLIWEADKNVGKLLAASGVIRKPGATAVYQLSDGKSQLVIKDGKIVDANASGHGSYPFAVGDAAALNGKTFSFSSYSTGPGEFAIEVTR